MSIFFGLLFARRFYCRSALSLSPGRTGGLFPRINAPSKSRIDFSTRLYYISKYNNIPCQEGHSRTFRDIFQNFCVNFFKAL